MNEQNRNVQQVLDVIEQTDLTQQNWIDILRASLSVQECLELLWIVQQGSDTDAMDIPAPAIRDTDNLTGRIPSYSDSRLADRLLNGMMDPEILKSIIRVVLISKYGQNIPDKHIEIEEIENKTGEETFRYRTEYFTENASVRYALRKLLVTIAELA